MRSSSGRLGDTNLLNADFTNTDLEFTTLDGAILSGVDLSKAFNVFGLHATALVECPAVPPPGLSCVAGTLLGPGANLSQADLHGVDLHGRDLHGANLTGSDLRGADLSGADLSAVNLGVADASGANLGNANLTDALVLYAVLGDMLWSATVCPDGTRSDTNGSIPESCCWNLAEPQARPVRCDP